jgi:hypothetical protein
LATDSRSIGDEHPIVKLITFGGGIPGIEQALDRVRRQAEAFPLIDVVEIFEPGDLGKEYFEKFGNLVKQFPRGFGLWSWKPFLVDREIKKLRDGDILIYMDAGCELNPKGAQVFSEYLDYSSRNGFLFFSLGLQHRYWTKPNQLLITEEHYFRNQVSAGVFFIKVSKASKKFVVNWLSLCASDEGFLLKDPDPRQNLDFTKFHDHRHDQSVLSKVVFDAGIEALPDGTFVLPWSLARGNPILALRNTQTGFSWVKPAIILPRPLYEFWKLVTVAISPGSLKRIIRTRISIALHGR